MKLALGTVQFGLDYGISNTHGQVEQGEVTAILSLAKSVGINTLDCAGAYGNSEQVIGEVLTQSPLKPQFTYVSKIPALENHQDDINSYLAQSLAHLKTENIDALLFHQGDNLISHPNKNELFQQALTLKSEHKINRIGASLYSPSQLVTIAEQFDLDLAQVPLNIFDQRFIAHDILTLCQQKNIKLHVRSLFLQGLIFLDEEQLASYFRPYQEKLMAFAQLANYLGCSKLTLALAIVAQELPYVDKRTPGKIIEKVVLGVCSTKQLTEIVTAYQRAKTLTIPMEELLALADNRLEFINPSLWSL